MSAVEEAVPLFLISQAGGLGLSPQSIGQVLSASGLVYILSKNSVYFTSMKVFRFYGSIRIPLLLSGFVIALVPFTSFIQGGDIAVVMSDGERTPYRDATWTKLIFLAIILGFHRIFFSTASASVVVGLNRSIAPHHRAAMNQLNKIGGNIAKTIGPVLSGSMIASSFLLFGSDIQRFGSVLAFLVLSVISISASVLSVQLLGGIFLIES